MDTRTSKKKFRTITSNEMGTKMIHNKATHGNKGKESIDEGANSMNKSDEIQDDSDYDAPIKLCVPRNLRAGVAHRLHQRR